MHLQKDDNPFKLLLTRKVGQPVFQSIAISYWCYILCGRISLLKQLFPWQTSLYNITHIIEQPWHLAEREKKRSPAESVKFDEIGRSGWMYIQTDCYTKLYGYISYSYYTEYFLNVSVHLELSWTMFWHFSSNKQKMQLAYCEYPPFFYPPFLICFLLTFILRRNIVCTLYA